jgi:hypothetical protein
MAISRYVGIPLLTAMSLAISLGLLSVTPVAATAASQPVVAEQVAKTPA